MNKKVTIDSKKASNSVKKFILCHIAVTNQTLGEIITIIVQMTMRKLI